MLTLNQWTADNQPRPEMLFVGAAGNQFARMNALATSLGCEAEVVATHRSKSIDLPVVRFTFARGSFLLRDNFHDLNLCVLWSAPTRVDPAAFLPVMSWADYLRNVERARNYSWRGWTDEEIADPRILRVQVTNPNGHTYWSEKRGEEKDRWTSRMTDPSWYSRDWSSGALIPDGTMPGCRFYVARNPFCEGISRVAPPEATETWSPGRASFTLVTGWEDVKRIMETIRDAEVGA